MAYSGAAKDTKYRGTNRKVVDGGILEKRTDMDIIRRLVEEWWPAGGPEERQSIIKHARIPHVTHTPIFSELSSPKR
jgi:hypothetical protein